MSNHHPYPEYKKSGVEWLGEIPEHWKTSRLKFLCDITTGGKDTENKVDDGKYPFYVRSQTVERIDSYSFNGEAILTAGDGVGVGKVFHYTNGKFDFHQRVYMFYSFRKVAGKFLFEYIKNNFYKVALAGVAKSTVDSLRLPLIQNFMITVPPLQEQQAIANYLDKATAKIDTLIEKQTKLIELLKEKRQATVDNIIHQDSTVDMRLGRVITRMSRSVNRKANKEYTALGLYNRGRGLFHKPSKEEEELGDSDFYWVQEDDLIISGQFAWEGSVALASEKENGCIVSHRYPVIRGKSGILDTEYLWAYFTTRAGDFLLNEHSVGSAGRNRPLNMNTLVKESIPVPTIEAQMQVARIVKAEKKIKKVIDKAIYLLKEKRTALISAVVTGKIDVREIA